MRRLLPAVALFLSACGVSDLDVQEEPYVDHDLGQLSAGLNAGAATGCDTSIVAGLTRQLVEELNCIAPNTMTNFSGPNITLSGSVQPYLAPGAANALRQAVAAQGTNITINSAYRSVAQQYLLYKWWQAGQCNIQVAAVPGRSNHQSGRAIDVPSYSFWRAQLTAHGWSWLGSSDLVHFDYNAAADLGSKSVLAFQRLWNKNQPNKLAEDGAWGPASISAMAQSPAGGFATHGCTPTPPPVTTGTLSGSVYRLNPADAADHSQAVAGAKVTVDGQVKVTGADGRFTATVAAGAYAVSVAADGYAPASVSKQVTAGQTATVAIGLTPLGMPDTQAPDLSLVSPADGSALDVASVTLTGTVSDSAGAVSALTLALNGATATPVSVMNGTFAQQLKLEPGANTVVLRATDAAGNVATLSVALTFRAGVEGHLANANGAPVEGLTVVLRHGGGAVAMSTQSAADGSWGFDLAQVPQTFTLEVSGPGYQPHEQLIDISADARLVVDVSMVADGSPAAPVPGTAEDMRVIGTCSSSAAAPGLAMLIALASGARCRRPRRAPDLRDA